MNRRFIILLIFCIFPGCNDVLFAWGTEGHRSINLNGIRSLPITMLRFREAEYYIADHASDVDRRKNRSTEETFRQFIKLERYLEFFNRTMPKNVLDLQKKYGEETVRQNGYLPYLIFQLYDSLQRCMKAKNWETTLSVVSDLGHYIGDLTMPLNTTINYDGQLTNNNGIKWRYEIEMMDRFYYQMNFNKIEPAAFASAANDPMNQIFALMGRSYSRIPLILRADTAALRIAKGKYNVKYYSALWKEVSKPTTELMQEGTNLFANLVYNAWLNSGGIKIVWQDEKVSQINEDVINPEHLEQNFPNPFNPITTIKYTLDGSFFVKLSVFNLFGQELEVLFEGRQSKGLYEFVFNGELLPGGVYFVRLQMNGRTEARKMILAK